MKIKSFMQKDRYGNSTSVEFFEDNTIPSMMDIPMYDHPGDPKGTDTVPAWLTPGEYVVNAEAVRMFEPQIEAMNEAGREVQRSQGGTIPSYEADGGPIYAQAGEEVLPLGLRQKNPGNIRPGANFIGESGANDGYAVFNSDEEGLRAIQRLLQTYGNEYNINTLEGFANRYAPPSDNNPTSNYIDYLSQQTGIAPDEKINLAERGADLIPAIVGFEQGQMPYTPDQINLAIQAAGTDDPEEVRRILTAAQQPEEQFSETSSGFNPINFLLGISNAEASTGEVPSISEEPPTPIYDFNSQIAESNLQSVEGKFRDLEARRLANLEAGRKEFDLINENTYNAYKEALEFQKQNVLEEREDLLPYLSPERSDFVLLSEEQRLAEEGIPSPEEVAVVNSPEYQAVQGRMGGWQISPQEFLEMQERNKDKNIPVKEEEKIDPLSNPLISSIINNTQANTQLDNTDPKDVENAADESTLGKVTSFLSNLFSEVLDGKEIARMAILYSGSRALGYNHDSSLNYASKQYVQREEQLYKSITSNKDAYSTASYTEYLKTRNPDVLKLKAPETKLGNRMYIPGFGLQQSVDIEGVPHIMVDTDNNPNTPDVAVNAISLGAVDAKDSLHDPEKIMERFAADIRSIEDAENDGIKDENRVQLDDRYTGQQASDLYFEFLNRYGGDPQNASKLQSAMTRALKKWGKAKVAYGNGAPINDPENSFRAYFTAETLKQTVGLSINDFGNTNPEKILEITNYAEQQLPSTKAFQEYFSTLNRIFNKAKLNNDIAVFTKVAKKESEINDFAAFVREFQREPGNPNNTAVQLYEKYK